MSQNITYDGRIRSLTKSIQRNCRHFRFTMVPYKTTSMRQLHTSSIWNLSTSFLFWLIQWPSLSIILLPDQIVVHKMLIIIAWKTSQIWTYLSPNKRNDTFLRLVATESHLGRSAKVRNQCAIWCNLTSLSCSCNVQTSYSTTEGIADQKMHRDTCRARLLRPHYLRIFEHCLPHMKWCITVWKMTHNAEWSHDRHWQIHAATRLRCHRSKTFTQLAWCRALFQACPCSFLKWRNALEVWHCLLEPANRVVLWSLLDLCSFSQEGLKFLPQQPRTRLHFSWLNVVLKRPQLNRNLNTVACNSVPINDCSTRIVQTLTILVASRTSIYRLAPGKIHLQKDKWQWFELNTSPC